MRMLRMSDAQVGPGIAPLPPQETAARLRQVMAERLDMLPANKQIGFFSDAYCIEWTYAKAIIVRRQLARVLAEKIDQGQYSLDEALAIAQAILFQSPQEILRMSPRELEA